MNLTITQIHELYRSEQETPESFILKCRQQAQTQADYNAWITLLTEEQVLEYTEQLKNKSVDDLPLYGIPFAIKDNIDLKAVPTTAACPEFEYVPDSSAKVVQLLLDAGAIPLGKTNLDQFATGLVGVRSPYGEGKNSFNTAYMSGGSSAGSAIATALGQVCFALGTDTAGSGRVPAALNNLIGHKPTKGIISNDGVVPACKTLDCVSIFTLTTEDAASVLAIAAQYNSEDPYSIPTSSTNNKRYYSHLPENTFKFGVPSQLDFKGDPETESMYFQAKKQLQASGGEAVEIDFQPFIEAALLLYEGPWVSERAWATRDVNKNHMLPVIQNIIGQSEGKTAVDAFNAQYRLAEYKRICDTLIHGLEFVLLPTCPTYYTREEIAADPIALNSAVGTYTNFMNLLDYSATAVPVGMTSKGISWGVTLFSSAHEDIKLLSYSSLIQANNNLPLGAGLNPYFANSSKGNSASSTVKLAVCGAHLEGQPLNWQLTDRAASLVEKTTTSKHYELYALADGFRPGLVRTLESGFEIEVEVWELPTSELGSFVAGIPQPLGIGKLELASGEWVTGFICDHFGLAGAKNISEFGSWRAWLKHKN